MIGTRAEMMLLSWQLAASIDFSPISTKPSFAEAYLGSRRSR